MNIEVDDRPVRCGHKFSVAVLGLITLLALPAVHSSGMQPETSLVLLYESEGEASINITNTDAGPALLYSTIVNIPEDTESLVILTPPVTRLEAGETQLVRFLRQGGEPSKVQRLKRVVFEGIGQRPGADGRMTVSVNVRQNLPLIIHPEGLEPHREPWKLLKWHIEAGHLNVVNDSAYVVRMAQEVELKPSGMMVSLPRAYVLPGETLTIDLEPGAIGSTSITLGPATVYGYAVDHYNALIESSTSD